MYGYWYIRIHIEKLTYRTNTSVISKKENSTDRYDAIINLRGAYDKFPDFFRMGI